MQPLEYRPRHRRPDPLLIIAARAMVAGAASFALWLSGVFDLLPVPVVLAGAGFVGAMSSPLLGMAGGVLAVWALHGRERGRAWGILVCATALEGVVLMTFGWLIQGVR